MREILFRGKRVDDKKWVEGFYREYKMPLCWQHEAQQDGINYFIDEKDSNTSNYVLPETVGQYTGLKDSTGKMIFEGDILEFEDLGEEGYEYKEGFDFINTASVVFIKGRFELENFWSDNSGVMEEMGNDHDEFMGVFSGSKIIGNIHDNPELLEVEE